MKKMNGGVIAVTISLCVALFSSYVPVQDDLKASMERGKKVYESSCLACHQANGSGVPGMNPPLKQTQWVIGSKDTLINIILNGMDEEIEVNGDFYDNVMPPHSFLNDQQIADVATYIRNSFGNKASAVKADEVKKLRK
jgi:mono/diheme cytochrome c family protein